MRAMMPHEMPGGPMPDSSKCHGEHCCLRDYCHRYTSASSGERQSWLILLPERRGEACEYYWPIGLDTKHQKRRAK